MNYYYLPIILLSILSLGLLVFIIFSKKKYDCKKYSQLPTKFSHQGDRDILDISKITQSSSYSQNDNNTYDISTVPMYLPNGLKVYIYKVIHNVQVKDINDIHLK